MKTDGTMLGELKGLPADPEIGGVTWSPDGKRFAFTNTTASTIDSMPMLQR